MADIIVDGYTAVWWVPTITLNAPTAVQVTAGTRLDTTMTAGGMEGFEASTATVETTPFSATYDTGLPGRITFDGIALVLKKQTATDTVFTTLSARNSNGHIVVRDAVVASAAAAVGQKIDIYPATTGQYSFLPREANTVLRYRVPFGRPTAEPVLQIALA